MFWLLFAVSTNTSQYLIESVALEILIKGLGGGGRVQMFLCVHIHSGVCISVLVTVVCCSVLDFRLE